MNKKFDPPVQVTIENAVKNPATIPSPGKMNCDLNFFSPESILLR